MKKYFKSLTIAAGVFFILFSPVLASAASTTDILFDACKGSAAKANSDACDVDKTTKTNPVNHIINVAASIIAILAGIVAVIMIIVSGFTFVTSGGNTEKTTNARRRLINSLIGLVVIALAWEIITFLTNRLVKT